MLERLLNVSFGRTFYETFYFIFNLAISDGMFDAINAARNLSNDSAPASNLSIELPPAEPANGQDNRNAGQ
jgi:hypothetical protein